MLEWQKFLLAAGAMLIGLILLPMAGYIGGIALVICIIAIAGYMVYKMIKSTFRL